MNPTSRGGAVGRRMPGGPGRLRAALTAIALLAGAAAWPQTVYRWVDDEGRTHFSDQVPDKYRSRATVITIEPAPRPVSAPAAPPAAARPASAPAAVAAPPLPPAAARVPPIQKRPPVGVTPDTDCATWRRLYDESVECFTRYRTVHGIKPEAFEHCTEIPHPDVKCGRTTR